MLEELGIPLPIGRPLVMQWMQSDDDPDGVLHFAYDGGVVSASTIAEFDLPPEELRSYRFVQPEEVSAFTSKETSARVSAAIESLKDGTFYEITT